MQYCGPTGLPGHHITVMRVRKVMSSVGRQECAQVSNTMAKTQPEKTRFLSTHHAEWSTGAPGRTDSE